MDLNIPPAERDRLRSTLGLDRPPVERFFKYIGNFYRGDLGVSFQEYPKQVIDIIKERLPRTLVLFLSYALVTFWAGFVIGNVLAWRRGGWIEYSPTNAGVMLYKDMCDKIAVMYLGKLVELAETEEVLQNPLHPYTQALLSAVPIPDPTMKRVEVKIKGGVSKPINPIPRCRFFERCLIAQSICEENDHPPVEDKGGGHFVACYVV